MNDQILKTQEELQKMRGNLKLQANLFKAEAKETWNTVEKKWSEYESKLHLLKSRTGESKEDILAALDLLEGEISKGYNKIKSTL